MDTLVMDDDTVGVLGGCPLVSLASVVLFNSDLAVYYHLISLSMSNCTTHLLTFVFVLLSFSSVSYPPFYISPMSAIQLIILLTLGVLINLFCWLSAYSLVLPMRQSESWYISIYIWALTRSFGDILHIKSVFLTFGILFSFSLWSVILLTREMEVYTCNSSTTDYIDTFHSERVVMPSNQLFWRIYDKSWVLDWETAINTSLHY